MPIELPPTCPRKLRRVIEKHKGKRHKIANELKINVGHIQNYMTSGLEPTRTDLRAKMFLPKTRRKPKSAPYRTKYMNWWRHLDKEARAIFIKSAFEKAWKDLTGDTP